jgi:hypothetical protein
MMIRKVMPLALVAVLIFPTMAVAADPPDVKGRWIGKTHSIIAGKGAHHRPARSALLGSPDPVRRR